jgi:hypothetical protein
MHGLRKTAARMLAEVGCSAHRTASVTGHKSAAEIEPYYTKAADQKRLASASIHRLEQRNRTASGKRPHSKVSNKELGALKWLHNINHKN